MALTKITGQVVDTTTDLVVGVTTVGGGVSATDGFFSGIVTAVGNASFSGNVQLKSTDDVAVNDVTASGNGTFTGNLTAADGTFSGNVTIGGTLGIGGTFT